MHADDVWVQPAGPSQKQLNKQTDAAKKHKNLQGMVRDFKVEKQRKWVEKEEIKEVKA